VFRAPGTYPITLTVDDGRGVGNSRAQSALELLVNRSPIAEAGPDQRVCPGAVTTFDGSASTDWDGLVTRHEWDFGDGSTGVGEIFDHGFSSAGTYTVRLRVEDDSGSRCSAGDDSVVVVVNSTPIADAGPDRDAFFGGAYDDVLFDAGGSSDPDGDPLTYSWDFGDGTTASGSRVFHAYDGAGTFTVRLTVRDGTGLPCGQATDTALITVRER
jgi:PKD repeat protein